VPQIATEGRRSLLGEMRPAESLQRPAALEPVIDVPDLSVVIPALDESANLRRLLPQLRGVLDGLGIAYELLVVTDGSDSDTRDAANVNGARLVSQDAPGYGHALISGLQNARGRHVLTMDADLSHPPAIIQDLWHGRHEAELHIASRYVPGAQAAMPLHRYVLSRILNAVFAWGLDVPIADLSSGLRLYDASVLRDQQPAAQGFDILPEIVVRAYAEGWRVRELPFSYEASRQGASFDRLLRVGVACLGTFWTLWKLRNSILAADYDDRAHDSRIFLQRYWQRQRYRHVLDLIAGEGRVLDVGCGSSRIVGSLPPGSIAIDVLIRKLRYARRFGRALVHGSGFALPFQNDTFPCVLCSQVIEHVPKESPILDELCRVLKPGGRLVLGTPDYANWQWVWIEKLYGVVNPGGYADEHIAHYTREELIRVMADRRLHLETERYILRGELIQAFRKR
jgi:glycosyltransferase involved in cell wall biosynthesis/predicted SAM-dependent methyltransferase